jgi:transcriptional regulator of met regulon
MSLLDTRKSRQNYRFGHRSKLYCDAVLHRVAMQETVYLQQYKTL